MLTSEPSSNVPGYNERSIASRAVGRNGDPDSGGVFNLVAAVFALDVPFDVDGMGTSTDRLVLRVAM